ncbi:MAG: DNA topoisomerase III [Candidatus Cloacimonetes bacterium]|nr:DNA topoisomerase III [Candidatus Cloacimonadota bacterium]
MKKLVLAEKPSVGRDLAAALGCGKNEKGYLEGARYIVTWALGHLVELAEPHDYNPEWKRWEMKHLPMVPEKVKLKVMRKTSQQFQVVRGLMKRADVEEVIIATDAGREGELVARWIIMKAGWKGNISRLWISSQTDKAIKEGFANLKSGKVYIPLYQAAQARAEADWLVGLNVTRALVCKFNSQLSAGRVQTPTLNIIVEREHEIEKFIPKPFWTLSADLDGIETEWKSKDDKNRFYEKQSAEEMLKKLKGQPALVESVSKKKKTENPPLAYDLTELQREANKQFGYSAKQTLQIIQVLYERHKICTYPRTDSRHITEDMVSTLRERLLAVNVHPWHPAVAPLLKEELKPGKNFVDSSKVSDHHAIIPTEKKVNPAALSMDEKKVFDLIVKRFLEVLYPAYEYNEIKLAVKIGSEQFFTSEKLPLSLGWKLVCSANVHSKPQLVFKMEKLRPGDRLEVKSMQLHEGRTTPPLRYTEASLLAAMEAPGKFITDENLREYVKDGGLGTPATRAEIIERLVSAYYIERKGKTLFPTEKGLQLVTLVPESMKSPLLTAEWEKRLSLIAQGKENWLKFIADIVDNTRELVKKVQFSGKEYHEVIRPDEKVIFEEKPGLPTGRGNRKQKSFERSLVKQYGNQRKRQEEEETLGDLFDF